MCEKTREFRILVTQNCNYNCSFCHAEGLQSIKLDRLSPTDIRFLYHVGRKYFNMNTITLTGGEPLFRRDIVDIANELYKEGGDITVVTNGYLLKDRIDIGNYINRIKISIPALKSNMYESIVRRKHVYYKTIAGIQDFREIYPNVGIEINMTIIEGQNSSIDDLKNMLEFAKSINASIMVIELFPPNSEGFVPLADVKRNLYENGFSNVPSITRKEIFSNGQISVRLTKIFCAIASEKEDCGEYCKKYNDLFVSPDGTIKPCRKSINEVNILSPIKERNELQTYERIKQAFLVLGKECIMLGGINNGKTF